MVAPQKLAYPSPNSRTQYMQESGLAQFQKHILRIPSLSQQSHRTKPAQMHSHTYISEQCRTIPPNRLSVQREQGELSIGQLWTWFVDSAILRWLGRSLCCGSSPLEDIFKDVERGADDARYGMLRIHRCFQALLCGKLECSTVQQDVEARHV